MQMANTVTTKSDNRDHRVERVLSERFSSRDVTVHIEPD